MNPEHNKNFEERKAAVTRETGETKVKTNLNLDGKGNASIQVEPGFFRHMLELFAYHSGFDLTIEAVGDVEVDDHHLVEDVGITLGQAFQKALGDKKGVNRFADLHLPMDEALILVAVDLSGRPYLGYQVDFLTQRVGALDLQLIEEFIKSFVNESKITLHVRKIAGHDSHHIAEAVFKGLGRGLKKAVARQGEQRIPSTKGRL